MTAVITCVLIVGFACLIACLLVDLAQALQGDTTQARREVQR